MQEILAAFFDSFSTQQWIAFIVLISATFTQLLYILYFFVRIALWKQQDDNAQTLPVSVVICAKNEEKNLRNLIPLLMDQDYPEFEVVVVNDNSWDGSEDTLKAFQVHYPKLHCIHLDEDKQKMQGKKFALTLGIKGAKHDLLLLTDADCSPLSNQWIAQMTKGLHNETSISIGFSPYKKQKGLLNSLIRYDAFQAGLNYLSFAKAKLPYMGVGRNLAYRKELFFEAGGFRNHMHVASGDDDLFINQMANGKNTSIQIAPDSQTESISKTEFKDWWTQKRRHLTTSSYYKFHHKIFLMVWPCSYYLLWVSAIFWMVMHNSFLIAGACLLLRYGILWLTLRGAMKKTGQLSLFWTAPLLEGLLWIVNPLLWMSNMLSKPKQWS
ncbi:MAG: glycosyltransferase [Flavobacteriales bacterium]